MTSTPLFNVTNDVNFTLSSTAAVVTTHSSDPVTREASNEHALLLIRLIVQKICVPLVVLIGVIGNSLSIVVLTRKCMKSSTNSYLTALALFDLLYLVFSFTLSLKHHGQINFSPPYVYYFPYGRVFADMCSNVSVILTVTFTVERYVGVCHPMKGRIICTPQRAKIITAVVSAVAILCTVPGFWEMEVVWKTRSDNTTYPVAQYTAFAQQASYDVGYYWFIVIMFTLLPLILLCVFNGILISTVISAAKLRKQMMLLTPASGWASNGRGLQSQPKEQTKITKMLITVVLVFIVCQLPGALFLLYTTYISLADRQVTREERNGFLITGNFTNLLVQINASINFILYSAISTKFRRVFYRILWKGRGSMCLVNSGRQSTFSRTDGLQMSSFYEGDRLGSKVTSFSSYTFKVRTSPRSMRTDRSSPPNFDTDVAEVTSRKHWGRPYRQNGHAQLAVKNGGPNNHTQQLWKANRARCKISLRVNGRNVNRRGGKLNMTPEQNGSCHEKFCQGNHESDKQNVRTYWANGRDQNRLWVQEDSNR